MPSTTERTPRLISISISHYCEKARWALDRASVAYVEEPHVIAFHVAALARARGGLTVPALRRPGGRTIAGSDRIVRFCDEGLAPEHRLVPTPEAARWETRLGDEFGPWVRRWAYGQVPLTGSTLLGAMGSAPRHELALWRAASPVFKTMARIRSGSTSRGVDAAWDGIVRTMDDVAGVLADGRRYLTGDRFTVADLTFASLAGPLLQPPTWGGVLVDPSELGSEAGARVAGLSDHDAGQFVLRLYRDHRLARV